MHESISHPKSRASRGPRAQARARFADAAAGTTFNGTYMRPNLSNDGSIPAEGPYCTSPDIWIGGTVPIDPSTLTTAASYATASSSNVALNETNFLYVRGQNGATTAQTNTVTLYYAPSALIQWPSQWQNNVIPTSNGNASGTIANLAPGAIGAAPDLFEWKHVLPPPAGSDHYCVFAQLNDANDSNPFPDIGSQVDMAALITNNLGWAWRNTVEVAGATWSFDQSLSIPNNSGLKAGTYNVYVTSKGFVGWQVSFACDQLDANGNAIAMLPTTITPNGQLVGVQCSLAPGFNSTISVAMNQNGAPNANPGDKITLHASYEANMDDALRAVEEGLVDWRLQRAFGGGGGIPVTISVPVGAQHFIQAPGQ